MYLCTIKNKQTMTALKISTMDGRTFIARGKSYSDAMKEAKSMARGSMIWKVEVR